MIKPKQKLGKYRIDKMLGNGGFAAVYRASDLVEGVKVALKIPHERLLNDEVMEDFRREVRLAAKLKHPHILPLKTADFIDGQFVIAFPLGLRTLGDRLQSRISLAKALEYSQQLLQAVAYAHQQRVIHCDIKPENLILFDNDQLMLTDFGIAKVAARTLRASGSGTLGYCAPEQAMGKPSFRSDVFAVSLIMYRMFTGHLPEWPFTWPPPRFRRLRNRVHPDLAALIRRGIEVQPNKRFANADSMLTAFTRIRSRAAKFRGKSIRSRARTKTFRDCGTLRRRQFQRKYGKSLETNLSCSACRGPVSEAMKTCPWCGVARRVNRGSTEFPLECPRCSRGLKLDWNYCPWCFGGGFEVNDSRSYPDRRYASKCNHPRCSRRLLMPFMRYCPWCRCKVKRKWPVAGSPDRCLHCHWGVVTEFWSFCPWCSKSLGNNGA